MLLCIKVDQIPNIVAFNLSLHIKTLKHLDHTGTVFPHLAARRRGAGRGAAAAGARASRAAPRWPTRPGSALWSCVCPAGIRGCGSYCRYVYLVCRHLAQLAVRRHAVLAPPALGGRGTAAEKLRAAAAVAVLPRGRLRLSIG